MASTSNRTRPERQQTDASLRVERERTDQALAARQTAAENEADVVIQRAREHADAVLEEARTKADEQLAVSKQPTAARATLVREREFEDEVLKDERASADDVLRHERDEISAALKHLLPLERNKTDRYLLTERARADTALGHRDDFLGIVSHDLRNLLGGIVTSSALLESETEGSDAAAVTAKGAERIRRYAARMSRLLGDLLDVASIDGGKLAIRTSPGDGAVVLREAVELFKAAAAQNRIALTAESHGDDLHGEFDHDRMIQLLANLITNAIKFTPSGGRVVVRCERISDELRFSITDTGMGIPANMVEAIFERFWQASKGDRRGVGLGLYIARCIVEAHGGKILVDSKPGVGSTFSFTIPVHQPARAAASS